MTATDRWVAVFRPGSRGGDVKLVLSALAGPAGGGLQIAAEDISWETDASVVMTHFEGRDIISDVRTRHFGPPRGGYVLALGYLEPE